MEVEIRIGFQTLEAEICHQTSEVQLPSLRALLQAYMARRSFHSTPPLG